MTNNCSSAVSSPFCIPDDPVWFDADGAAAWEVARALQRVAAVTHVPVYTVEVGGGLTMTVIRVALCGRDSYQVYAVEARGWSLVGLAGLYCDALSEIAVWRNFIASGGSLQRWLVQHPDGVAVA